MALLGGYQFEEFENVKMKQRPASAWSAVECEGLVGASFKPILYCGVQMVRGVNHLFIAEETLATLGATKRIVAIVVNEFNGEYAVVKDKFQVIFG